MIVAAIRVHARRERFEEYADISRPPLQWNRRQ